MGTSPCLFSGFVTVFLWTASRQIQYLYMLVNTVHYLYYLFWNSQNRKKQFRCFSLQSLDMPIPYGVYLYRLYYLKQIEWTIYMIIILVETIPLYNLIMNLWKYNFSPEGLKGGTFPGCRSTDVMRNLTKNNWFF